MTTEMTLFSAGVPAHISNRDLNANTLALTGSGATNKRISIDGKVFRLMVNGKEVTKSPNKDMNIVIARTAPTNSRIYYDPNVKYERGNPTPPLCSSADGIRPDSRVTQKQCDSCANCPQNVAGSGNGESRACRYQRRLAVVLEGDLGGDVYQLVLPATSLFGKGNGGNADLPLEAYARMLAANRANIDAVVTKMKFDDDSSTPKLTFTPVRFLTAQELAIVESQGDTPEAEQAIGLTPYQMDTGGKPPAIAAPVAAPIASPAQEVEPPAKATRGRKPAAVAEPVVDDPEVLEPEVIEEPKVVVQPAVSERDDRIAKTLAAWG